MNRESYLQRSMEPGVIAIHGTVLIGATGAVGTITGRGITSVTRNSAGVYTIVFDDVLTSFLGGTCDVLFATECVSKPQFSSQTVATQATKNLVIKCYDDDGNTGVTELDDGALLMFTVFGKNTGA